MVSVCLHRVPLPGPDGGRGNQGQGPLLPQAERELHQPRHQAQSEPTESIKIIFNPADFFSWLPRGSRETILKQELASFRGA